MQETIKQNTLKLLQSGPLDVKDVLKALKKVAGLEDVNKSSVNKILYAAEKSGLVKKTAETPPVWSLVDDMVAAVENLSKPKTPSPEQERPKVAVFKIPKSTIFVDQTTQPCLEKAAKLIGERIYVRAFLSKDALKELWNLEGDEPDKIRFQEAPELREDLLMLYTMTITTYCLAQLHRVILVTSDDSLKTMAGMLKDKFKAKIVVVTEAELEAMDLSK